MSQKSRGHRPPVQPKHASGRVSLEEALGQDSYTVPTLFGSPGMPKDRSATEGEAVEAVPTCSRGCSELR